MNKTLVGIVTLGIGTLGMNALSSNDTVTLPSPVTTYNISDNVKKDESDRVNINKTLNNSENLQTKSTFKDSTIKEEPIYSTLENSNDSNCDPNYSGCVPIASDVDCAGGRGNGPAYIQGPIRVTGNDIYGLDRDHDGWGCE